jgi:hypothetical protein
MFNIPLVINLPEYVEWNEDEMITILSNELNWGEGKLGREHMDCEIAPVKCYLRYQRWGFGSKTQKFAALVRDGQISRDNALELIMEEKIEPKENLDILLEKLNLSTKDLERIKKSYHLDCF